MFGNLYLNDELLGPAIPEIPPLDLSSPPQYIRSLNFPLSVDIECPLESEIDVDAFGRLAYGLDSHPLQNAKTFSVVYKNPRQVQVRRHKKKRINKKWAKRYGYKTVYDTVQLDNVQFRNHLDDEYELITNDFTVIKGR